MNNDLKNAKTKRKQNDNNTIIPKGLLSETITHSSNDAIFKIPVPKKLSADELFSLGAIEELPEG